MLTDTSLHSRLRNCLQTILELEGALDQTSLGDLLRKEFNLLKEVAHRLENIPIAESEVARIEVATAKFLHELRQSLDTESLPNVPSTRVLH